MGTVLVGRSVAAGFPDVTDILSRMIIVGDSPVRCRMLTTSLVSAH